MIIGTGVINTTLEEANISDKSPIDNATLGIISPYQTGTTVCEIIAIIAVTLFTMKKLFSTGVLPEFEEGDKGGL